MRLADFILANVEPILVEWEQHARSIWHGEATDPATLRDHAHDILMATSADMNSPQTEAQRKRKSTGDGDAGDASASIDSASKMHGAERGDRGLNLADVVAEYRAVRASVLRQWRESGPQPDLRDLEDVTRFNESIDQSLTEGVDSFRKHANRCHEELAAANAARAGAENANVAKDEFLAMLSHELRTPLTAIVGWVSILRSESCKEDDLQEGLAAIDRNTKAQVQLISDILDVSRIVAGKLRLDLSLCDLAEVVRAGVDVMRPVAVAKGISLDVQLDSAAGRASCDPARMQQVVWNLIANAVKFTPKGGTIRVTLSRTATALCVEVSDTGKGMKAEFLPEVFDRFSQAYSGSRRQQGGLGLGLSIVQHLVGLHGGTIDARSAGEGLGATFTVRLPVPAEVAGENGDGDAKRGANGADREEASPPAVRLDGLRVMAVDDEPDARRMLVKVLESAGAIVTSVASVREAMGALDAARPEVLVSDIGMPDENGFDLIRQVRRAGHQPRDLPAVALTAFVQKADQRMALMAGFQVHVAKPVNPHDLTAVIASLAGRTGLST